MPSLILAFDIGTSSTRSALFDLDGVRLPKTLAQQDYPLLTSDDGAAEIDPQTLLKAVRNCLAKTMAARRTDRKLRTQTIRAVGVSCFWHSLIGCDTHGVPLTPVITWADARCRSDAARLRAEISERDAHARTGCMLRSSFWPAKVAWFRRTRPALFRRIKIWMSPAEWAQQQLVGETTCAIGMATGTGLFDPHKLDWDDALLDHLHLRRAHLNPLSDEPAIVGAPLAARFPELRGVPWFPAIGDGAASNLGCGATVPGLAAMNVGTSAALRLMRRGRNASAPFGLFCYRIDADRYLVGGAASNAGNLRAWCLRELKIPDETGIDQLLTKRPGPVTSLTVLPFWTAERAPAWNEEETGLIHGVTQHTSALDLFQAITDAGYHRLRQIGDLLLGKNAPPVRFIVSGGIQKSLMAVQRLADVTGFDLYPSDEPEASLRGAAVYALEKTGAKIAPGKLGAPIRPRPRWTREHAQQREKQIALEEILKSQGLVASPSRR